MELSSLSILPFERHHIGQVIKLWRLLHPNWSWLSYPSAATEILRQLPNREYIRFVVEHRGSIIATVFTSRGLDESAWGRTRTIAIEAQATDGNADWVVKSWVRLPVRTAGRRGMIHLVNTQPNLSAILRPVLEAEGFSVSFKVLRMEWNGDTVGVPQPSPIRFRRYAGGDRDLDGAIVDLHNCSFRTVRLKQPMDVEGLWRRHATLQRREFVLAMEAERLVGYAEWSIDADEAWIAYYAVARSHWGTGTARMLGTRVMEAALQHGYTRMAAITRSTNAAVMRQAHALGWTIASELSYTFTRRL
jgi:GNAT superfamily N-acetyltransferase